METKNYSRFQRNIFAFVKNGKGNAVVNAVAGSGKTTTLIGCLELIPETYPTIFLAFNKSIVKELKARVYKTTDEAEQFEASRNSHIRISTLHSLGWTAMRQSLGKNIELNEYKVKDALKVLGQVWEENVEYTNRVAKLVDLIRVNLVQSEKELFVLATRNDIEVASGECARAFETMKIINKNEKVFDFVDMIYVPATNPKVRMQKYRFVFVDECQDLNRAQQAMLDKIIDPLGGRFIAVGDPRQAIYGFAGADVESFKNLCNKPNTIQLPLSVCYRCGSNIIAAAQKIVPTIQAREGAQPGVVRAGSYKEITDRDFVLCRNNLPLVQMCLQFIGEGRKAYVKGSDIGANLINLIKRQEASSIEQLFYRLELEVEKISRKLRAKGLDEEQIKEHSQVRLIWDKIEVISVLSKDCRTVEEIILCIEIIFKNEAEGICLSSIHKSKGLEAEKVFIICDYLLPSPYAKQAWQAEQEQNLRYVMITRAKNELVYVNDWEVEIVKPLEK